MHTTCQLENIHLKQSIIIAIESVATPKCKIFRRRTRTPDPVPRVPPPSFRFSRAHAQPRQNHLSAAFDQFIPAVCTSGPFLVQRSNGKCHCVNMRPTRFATWPLKHRWWRVGTWSEVVRIEISLSPSMSRPAGCDRCPRETMWVVGQFLFPRCSARGQARAPLAPIALPAPAHTGGRCKYPRIPA